MLNMIVGIDTQIMLDGLGEVAPSDLEEILEEGFEYPNKDRKPRDDEELGAGIFNTELGEERIFLRDDDIYRCADQDGRGEVEEFVEDRIEGGEEHGAAVRGGVTPEAGEGVGFVHGVIISTKLHEGARSFFSIPVFWLTR